MREDIILLAAGALRALQAADEKNRDPHRHQDGQEIRIRHEPMDHTMHIEFAIAYSTLVGRFPGFAGLSPKQESHFLWWKSV